ncbi:alpha/beta family hydrolase [Bacillus sp. ISL-7]|uniref:alpha/beta family hydrolase n=1 Tax=Bacillus sp. ISL-7 TaxID=2819136 RepID=UPI001BECD3CE|nr:alpha/beta family hydrolase [Bacillus sp. ISL-7]MBT2736087.1 hypothetical protein [Bacillus sp. ISL-7]
MTNFIEGKTVRNEHSSIPYLWIRQDQQSDGLCIMLPGLGYTTQAPLFYYATGVFVNNNMDVLRINYDYRKKEYFSKLSGKEQDDWMYEDVKAVIQDVLKETQYEQYYIVNKSLGSIPMAYERTQNELLRSSYGIWLTPLLKDETVYNALLSENLPALCIIGDKDPHFFEDRIQAIKSNNQIHTVIIPNANHSLEINEDVYTSIQIVNQIMNEIQSFINKCRTQKIAK